MFVHERLLIDWGYNFSNNYILPVFKFDGNFILLSFKCWWWGHYKCLNTVSAFINLNHHSGCVCYISSDASWLDDMKMFPHLLALCAGKPPVTGWFPAQRDSNVDVSFVVYLNNLLQKVQFPVIWDAMILV